MFFPHQIFIANTDIWNGGIHAAARVHSRKGRGSAKRGAPPAGRGVAGERKSLSSAVGLDVKSIPALCRLGSARRLLSALQRPLGCCNLPSAPPDYRLLRGVRRRAAGRARRREEGRLGGTEEAAICGQMSKILRCFLFAFDILDVFSFFSFFRSVVCITTEDNYDLFH